MKGFKLVCAVLLALFVFSPIADAHRTLPHDHSTRGRGGDIAGTGHAVVTVPHTIIEATDTTCNPAAGSGTCTASITWDRFEQDANFMGFMGWSVPNGTLRISNNYEVGDIAIATEAASGNEEIYMLVDASAKRVELATCALFPCRDAFTTSSTGSIHLGNSTNAIGGTQQTLMEFANASEVLLGSIGYGTAAAASIDFIVEIDNHGAAFDVRSENAAGTQTPILFNDPDTEYILYRQGVSSLASFASGTTVRGSTSGGVTGTHQAFMNLADSAGVGIAEFGFGGFVATSTLTIQNRVQDGNVSIHGTDGASAEIVLWEGDPANHIITEEGGGRYYAIKTADETVTNSTTFQDDNHLGVTGVELGNYSFEMSMRMSGASADDIKFNFASAADTVVGLQVVGCTWISDDGTMSQDAANIQSTTLIAQTIGGSSITVTTCTGILEVQTAGDLQMQWAQNAASVVAGTIYEGSWLRIEKYGN